MTSRTATQKPQRESIRFGTALAVVFDVQTCSSGGLDTTIVRCRQQLPRPCRGQLSCLLLWKFERRLQMLQRVTAAVVDNLGDCITDRCGSHVARRLLSVAAGRAVGPAAVRKPKSTLFEDEPAEQPAPQVQAQPPDTS